MWWARQHCSMASAASILPWRQYNTQHQDTLILGAWGAPGALSPAKLFCIPFILGPQWIKLRWLSRALCCGPSEPVCWGPPGCECASPGGGARPQSGPQSAGTLGHLRLGGKHSLGLAVQLGVQGVQAPSEGRQWWSDAVTDGVILWRR